jgi:hypothetical protein
MPLLRNTLRVVFIWMLSGLVAPYVSRIFGRLARRAPRDGFVEGMLIELSQSYSATGVRVGAELMTGLMIETITFLLRLAAELRVRPSNASWRD